MSLLSQPRRSFPSRTGMAEAMGMPSTVDMIDWRGHGGRHPTYSSVEFDRQLDKVAIWLENWDHEQRCRVLEAILRESSYTQFQFLFTVVQPALHRDFMYTAQTSFPSLTFQPVSTHITREVKSNFKGTRQDTGFYRVKSAYLQLDDEVKDQVKDKEEDQVKLPALPTGLINRRNSKDRSQVTGCSLLHLVNQSQPNSPHQKEERWHRVAPTPRSSRHQRPSVSVDPILRFVDMPVRRHMQEEEALSPRSSRGSSPTSPRFYLTLQQRGRQATDSASSLGVHQSARQQRRLKGRRRPSQEVRGSNSEIASPRSARAERLDFPEEAHSLLDWYTNQWNDTKKNEFLHKLLLKLDPRELFFISTFLSVKQHRDFIALLPNDLALKILGYLTPAELLIASRVSKTWEVIANSNELWQSKCREVKLKVPVSNSPIWKKVFKDNWCLRLNWNNGVCNKVDLKGHTQNVLTVIFDDTRLASGSADKTIRVWDIKTGQLLHLLKGHTRGVWCLNFLTKYLLVSGSYDSTIRVWNLRTGAVSRTLVGHTGPVWALIRRKHVMVSGSQDRTAKIWDMNHCHLMNTLIGHNAAVFAVDMNDDGSQTFTGSADRSIRVWDTGTGKCLKVIWASPSTSIMAVSYSRGFLACSYGETIALYQLEGAKLLNTFQEHRRRVETLELRMAESKTGKVEGMIVSAGKDGMVKYWDIHKTESIQTFKGHSDQVNCIHFDALRIVSASFDHKIRIWDFNV